MLRSTYLPIALIAFSLTASATLAQAPDPVNPSNNYMQDQAAPIQRGQPDPAQGPMRGPMQQGQDFRTGQPRAPRQTTLAVGQLLTTGAQVQSIQAAEGVFLRVAPNSSVRAVSLTGERLEFKVERGLVNLSVYHAADGSLILVDLPGGQVQALKNGFYTFNARTNTTRTLKGETLIVPVAGAKAVKVKEQQAFNFAPAVAGSKPKAQDFAPLMARNDVIPSAAGSARHSDGGSYGYGYGPGAGFYGDGLYEPYYAFGFGYPGYGYGGWDYGYGGWGYPYGGFGIGFGGGFYGRGFYGGGFRGRR